jgi:8-oxo-dGTP diphosphatase
LSQDGQRADPRRYTLIPRTLVFLIDQGQILLVKLPAGRGEWSGRYNGVGGHVEQGEDPAGSARREVLEETGLMAAGLRLCGVLTIDTGTCPGIGLYVFVGKAGQGTLGRSREGEPAWLKLSELSELALVEDLPSLIPRSLESYASGVPFSATYHYDEAGQLTIQYDQ